LGGGGNITRQHNNSGYHICINQQPFFNNTLPGLGNVNPAQWSNLIPIQPYPHTQLYQSTQPYYDIGNTPLDLTYATPSLTRPYAEGLLDFNDTTKFNPHLQLTNSAFPLAALDDATASVSPDDGCFAVEEMAAILSNPQISGTANSLAPHPTQVHTQEQDSMEVPSTSYLPQSRA